MVVIPGNHDSRNVGYVHFEELFGERNSVLGSVGDDRRGRLERARPRQRPDRPRPVPPGSRSSSRPARSCASSSSTTICCRSREPAASATSSTMPATRSRRLQRAEVDLVLSGHKHVPYAWRLENLFVVNAGTVSSSRLRGKGGPVTTSSRSRARTWTSGGGTRSTGRRRSSSSRPRRRRTRSTRRRSRTRCARRERAGDRLIDGEHYAPVVRDALAALPYDVVGALLVGGTEKLQGGDDYGVAAGGRARRGGGGPRLRPLRRAGARAAGADALGVARARARAAVRRGRLPLRPPPSSRSGRRRSP